ncbi:MAG: SPOR domain-containing protein [Vibrio sp.]
MLKWMEYRKLSLVWLLLAPLTGFASSEYWCEAQQAAINQLPVLDPACPIGEGLWGKAPQAGSSLFWIQCGMLSQPMPLASVKTLYQHISTDIWLKPEVQGSRCLIGPYHDFSVASQELKQIKKLASFEQAFIRQVIKNTAPQPVRQAKELRSATPTVAQAVSQPAAVNQSLSTPPNKPISAPTAASTQSLAKLNSMPRPSANNDFVLRQSIKVGSQTFALPYTGNPQVPFYMEHDLAWNRLDYAAAQSVCQQLAMRLPSEQEWSVLLNSQQMQAQRWPVQLPYWGEGRKGLFATGKVNPLNGSSLLNVLCVKSDL